MARYCSTKCRAKTSIQGARHNNMMHFFYPERDHVGDEEIHNLVFDNSLASYKVSTTSPFGNRGLPFS